MRDALQNTETGYLAKLGSAIVRHPGRLHCAAKSIGGAYMIVVDPMVSLVPSGEPGGIQLAALGGEPGA